jgi:hypothetical protein
MSRVSPVNIVSDYAVDDRAIGVRSPAEAKGFFLQSLCPDRVLSNGYRGFFPRGVKAIPPLPPVPPWCVVGVLYLFEGLNHNVPEVGFTSIFRRRTLFLPLVNVCQPWTSSIVLVSIKRNVPKLDVGNIIRTAPLERTNLSHNIINTRSLSRAKFSPVTGINFL